MGGGMKIGSLGFLKARTMVQSEQTVLLLIPWPLWNDSPYKNVALLLKIVIATILLGPIKYQALLRAFNITSNSLNNPL